MSTLVNRSKEVLNQLRFWCTILLLLLINASLHAEEVTYYHLDALGSTVAATDESGNLLWKEAYRPYGERIRKEDANTNDIWYTGKPHEEEMGLSYFGARWYDPVTGRFMAIDPVGVKEENIHSFNRYAYANNNPYKYIDPDGRDSFLVSRPLDLPVKGNHNFIVSNANFLGDPQATVSSFGDVGNDTMGQVDRNTKGFSQGTSDTDTKAWQSLSSGSTSVTYRQINASDSAVDALVSKVDKGLEYSFVPEIQGGVNSNTAAGAVAKKADRGTPFVRNNRLQPGSKVTNRIKFK